MKKYVKFLSAALAVLMIILTFPFTAMAKTLTTGDDTWQPLITLDNLADTTNNVTGSEHTVDATIGYKNGATVNGNTVVRTASTSNNYWAYSIVTDIVLTETSEYKIEFKAQGLEAASTAFGLCFGGYETGTNAGVRTENLRWDTNGTAKNMYICCGTDRGYQPKYGKNSTVVSDCTWDFFSEQESTYVMAINGKNVSLSCGDVVIFQEDMTKFVSAANTNLVIGLCGISPSTTTAEAQLATMTDITVYGKAGAVNNYKDGDVLLTMPTPFGTEFESEFSDLTVTPVRTENVYTNGDTLYAPEGITYGLKLAGVSTNLPLNENTAYTVEFFMKEYGNEKVAPGLSWSGTTKSNSHAFYVSGDNNLVSSRYGGYGEKYAYGNFGNVANRITYGDEDGYIRYTVVIDGYDITLYMGGEKIGETLNYSARNEGQTATAYTSSTLQLNIGAYNNSNAPAGDNNPWVSVKNLTVWAGDVTPSNKVQFVKGNEVLQTVKIEPDTDQVITEFPEVTPEKEGNLIKWFYKNTNIIVNTPYTVTHDAVIEAREIDPTSTVVAGAQCTTPADNKQSIRFIATLHTLQASEAGFVVEAKFKETVEGVETLSTKRWEVTSTVVYTSILTTENGSVKSVSAGELGGAYLIALAVDDVPTNIGQIDFYVTSYITVGGEDITSGEPAVYTMKDGSFDKTLTPLT